ncbi:MAG: hypothetical protein FD126_3408, partial [Elusimicrobia bacterium]
MRPLLALLLLAAPVAAETCAG